MNVNLTIQNVYTAFRKAQSISKGRGYRLPKDWDKHLAKMNPTTRTALDLVNNNFNTRWKEIDPQQYFECGFELLSSFSYHNFMNPKIIKLYIQKDKNIKRRAELNKKTVTESAKWVRRYIREHEIRSFHVYCMTKVHGISLPVKHYMENKIDPFFLMWLIKDRMIWLSDNEEVMIPYIMENYRKNIIRLEEIQIFLKKLREIL